MKIYIKVARFSRLFVVFALCLTGVAEVEAVPLNLREVIQSAVASHPALQSQQRLLESARADVSTARQQFLPTPSVGVEKINSTPTDVLYRGNANLQTYRLQQPLWTGGRLTAGLEKAQAQAEAAEAGVSDAAIQLSLRAVQAWSEWYSATLKLTAVNASVQTHQRLIQQVKRRVDEGAAAPAELVLTKGRLAQTVSTQQAIVTQVRAARLKVSQLMGLTIKEDATPQESLKFEPENLALLETQALDHAPVLRKLQAQQQAQKAEIRERKADLMPEIYLRVEHQRSQYDSAVMSSVGVNRAYFGLSSRFGAGLSNITQQESLNKRLESIEADTEAVKRNLSEQIQTDYEMWSSLKTRIPELELAMQATRKTAEAWDRQFLAGRKSWMEVMNTARELMQAELELVDAQASFVNAKWRLSILGYGVEKTMEQQALIGQTEIQGGQQ